MNHFAPRSEGPVHYQDASAQHVYVRGCYPDASSGFLTLEAGGEKEANIRLVSGDALPVRIKEILGMGDIRQPETQAFIFATWNDPTGEIVTFSGTTLGGQSRDASAKPALYLARGSYFIELRTAVNQRGAVAHAEIEVGDSPPPELKLALQNQAMIETHVHTTEGADAAGKAAIFFKSLTARSKAATIDGGSRIAADPGEYWISIQPRAGLCATSVLLDGRETLNRRVAIAPGAASTLDITLGTSCGFLDVRTVLSANDAPFADFILLPDSVAPGPRTDIGVGSFLDRLIFKSHALADSCCTTGSNSHCVVGPLSPGHYRLWAWIPGRTGYAGPDLADPGVRASDATVRAGETAFAVVELTRPAEAR